jgi:F0F1-type ATP synthase epsilon subunit
VIFVDLGIAEIEQSDCKVLAFVSFLARRSPSSAAAAEDEKTVSLVFGSSLGGIDRCEGFE